MQKQIFTVKWFINLILIESIFPQTLWFIEFRKNKKKYVARIACPAQMQHNEANHMQTKTKKHNRNTMQRNETQRRNTQS